MPLSQTIIILSSNNNYVVFHLWIKESTEESCFLEACFNYLQLIFCHHKLYCFFFLLLAHFFNHPYWDCEPKTGYLINFSSHTFNNTKRKHGFHASCLDETFLSHRQLDHEIRATSGGQMRVYCHWDLTWGKFAENAV